MVHQRKMHFFATATLRVLHLPRLVRLILAMIGAIAFVLLVFPIVDYLYIEYFFNLNTVIVPSIVSVVLGALYYLWGWVIIVTPRQIPIPSWKPIALYLVISMIVFMIDIMLITTGISMLDTVAG